jgi:hypothetical protein
MRLRADVEYRMARRGEGLRPKGVPVPSRVAAWWACVRGARAEKLPEHQLVGRLRSVAQGRRELRGEGRRRLGWRGREESDVEERRSSRSLRPALGVTAAAAATA